MQPWSCTDLMTKSQGAAGTEVLFSDPLALSFPLCSSFHWAQVARTQAVSSPIRSDPLISDLPSAGLGMWKRQLAQPLPGDRN